MFGATRTTRALAARLDEKVDRSAGPDACWPWRGARDRKGYGRMSRGRRGQGLTGAHRIAWELAHGPIPDDLCVLHRCDNPPCCNPRHLWLGTIADNNADMTAKGRNGFITKPEAAPRGARHGNAKLTADAVRAIRARYASGTAEQRQLAAEFGVHQQVIWSVIRRKTWAHVLDQDDSDDAQLV